MYKPSRSPPQSLVELYSYIRHNKRTILHNTAVTILNIFLSHIILHDKCIVVGNYS